MSRASSSTRPPDMPGEQTNWPRIGNTDSTTIAASWMGMFAVLATYEIAPEQIVDFLPLLLAHRDRCLKDESGTLQFDVLRHSWRHHG
jgi:hypothetical protein